ncbi:hypothetical protein U5801_19815 [Lamprobacter modestohalophilus]|uniref:hypothetical protein n=1 Tax=Lamprobacter modestohalophilus TaxID=1064514 RepID=UPI002ADED30C|nr:hypothetical protein [Lamprobacter modestohalophilus]MEA1052036.1 hypothetical protein [Lamprobacter modestohalophilus]
MDLIAPSSSLYLPQWRSSRRVKIIRNRLFYPPLLLKISMQANALATPQPHQVTVRAFFFMGDADVSGTYPIIGPWVDRGLYRRHRRRPALAVCEL